MTAAKLVIFLICRKKRRRQFLLFYPNFWDKRTKLPFWVLYHYLKGRSNRAQAR